MPTWTFKTRFAPLVETGLKTQTIRAPRRYEAKVGQTAYLYAGSRFVRGSYRQVAQGVVTEVRSIFIDADVAFTTALHPKNAGYALVSGEPYLECVDLDGFARADGFEHWDDLVAWFMSTHGLPFEGTLVKWRYLEPTLWQRERGGL